MSKWPGKYVIGLTGNIATGKSVVRKMLEHLGAYSIDADALSHRAIAKGAPGYQPVVDTFGKWIVNGDGEVDRDRLGHLVFTDPDALRQLEIIVHPLVEQAVDLMIRRARQPVVVLEAIKLIEGKLVAGCDAVWTTIAPEPVQRERLMNKRHLSAEEALVRIRSQGPQEEKTAAASVIIQNSGSFEDTWEQVLAAWKAISPRIGTSPLVAFKAAEGELSIQRGRPRDSSEIAALINRLSRGSINLSHDDIMAAFGEKAFLLLMSGKQMVGLIGWQVENLVARITDLYIDSSIPIEKALKMLIAEVERASQDLQCEASLFFLPQQGSAQESFWHGQGYSRRTLQTLGVQAWRDAAIESQPPDTILLFKQLRQDRVLRPI